jgi:putative intracellular protease/amidase
VFAAVYAARVPEDNPVAKESIEEALDVANGLDGTARTALIEDAIASFDAAARWGLAVCMGVLLLAAARAATLQVRKGGSPTSGEPSTERDRSSVRVHS